MKKNDQVHMRWIYDRMVHVHGENPNVDYMLRFNKIIPPILADDEYVVRAHAAVRHTCERWRRRLLVTGDTDHLHSRECMNVAELLRERKL